VTQTPSDESPIEPTADVTDENHQPPVPETTPTDDRSEEQKAQDAVFGRVFLECLTEPALRALLEARRKRVGAEAFAEEAESPDGYARLLTDMADQHSAETDRILDVIASVADKTLFDTRLRRDGKTILGIPKPQRTTPSGGVVSGADAVATFSLLTGRTRRVALYNSGFSVDISQPDLAALNVFMSRHRERLNEYGRMFGSYFFYFHSLMIKEAIVELIQPLILHSTLKNWNRADTLMRNIKLVDLKLLLNAVASLMYPEGYSFTHICTNPAEPECTYNEQLLIDLTKLPHHDFSKLPEPCIQHMSRQAETTPEVLSSYQKNLGFDGRVVRHGLHGFELRIPSIIDHLEYGRIYNGTLLSNIFADSPNSLNAAVLYSFYRIYAPFVSRYTLYDEDDTPEMIVEDRAAIATILSQLQQDDQKGVLAAAFDAFITQSEISHVCYAASPCPSCGFIPPNGYYTVDPELTFFILLATKLTQS